MAENRAHTASITRLRKATPVMGPETPYRARPTYGLNSYNDERKGSKPSFAGRARVAEADANCGGNTGQISVGCCILENRADKRLLLLAKR